ncbi:hypothetical protein HD806DRAFT_536137 [Xylariaceae sp. AK1471]|nr:hypothetical protein HD806DRAFT_536137 [Xylariaceae sp. AK1471]
MSGSIGSNDYGVPAPSNSQTNVGVGIQIPPQRYFRFEEYFKFPFVASRATGPNWERQIVYIHLVGYDGSIAQEPMAHAKWQQLTPSDNTLYAVFENSSLRIPDDDIYSQCSFLVRATDDPSPQGQQAPRNKDEANRLPSYIFTSPIEANDPITDTLPDEDEKFLVELAEKGLTNWRPAVPDQQDQQGGTQVSNTHGANGYNSHNGH